MPLLVFCIITGSGYALIASRETNWRHERRDKLEDIAEVQGVFVQRQLGRSMISAYLLGHYIRERGGNDEGFETYAEKLIREIGGITNLQLAPSGVISRIYPLTGYERAIGFDILSHPERGQEARQAIDSGYLTLVGPLRLIDDDLGVLGRYPIFLEPGNRETFWGFTTALVRLDEFIASSDLPGLKARGFEYQLWHINPHSGKKEVFAGRLEGPLQPPVASATVSLANKAWYLDIALLNPRPHSPNYWMDLGLALFSGCVVALVVFLYLKLPEKLRMRVIRQTRELEELAFYDSLTKLPNRKLFSDRLSQATRRQRRTRKPFALIFLDLDGFKRINDTLGHDIGDKLIAEIGNRLRNSRRKSDTVARLGGDEFTIILNDLHYNKKEGKHLSEVIHIVQDILDTLSHPIVIGSHTLTTTASIGITLCPDDGTEPTKLLRNADLAMYRAKQQGKNIFHFFSEDLDTEATRRMELEEEIHVALQKNQFFVHYQPIVSLSSRQVVAVEALVRWRHPIRGIIPPSDFIPVAGESNLILEIGEMVLKTACTDIARLNRMLGNTSTRLNINLSHRQFRQPGLMAQVMNALENAGLAPAQLGIELTESALMGDLDQSMETLNSLKQVGISLSIDDFGTGYSSLSLLKQLPVDTLKIDREFVRDIPRDADDMEIVSAVIFMAHKLKLRVVAEGVENFRQLQFLESYGCDQIQGYLTGHPLSIHGLEAFLRAHATAQPSLEGVE